jgi:hypothetical protein
MFKRGRSTPEAPASLPEERKALVERYMIDAEQAQERALRMVERHAARTEPDQPVAARAEAHAAEPAAPARPEAERPLEASRPVGEERAPAPVAPHPRQPAADGDLPVYVWLQRVVSSTPSDPDWTRELVRAQEARTAEAREAAEPFL